LLRLETSCHEHERSDLIVNVGHALISCPRCESALIQIHDSRSADLGTLLDRHCPECDHRDVLSVATPLAELVLEHAAELARCLEELADRLEAAGELWLAEVEQD
jgi:hypothetical protein